MTSIRLLSLALTPLLLAGLIPILDSAFAQESPKYLNRSAEVWGEFYRYMLAAFIFGAAFQSLIIYIVVRFRDKGRPQEVTR